jgi:hypothetical protein
MLYINFKALRPRGVAQLVEHRSPKPKVAGSSPVSPANSFNYMFTLFQLSDEFLNNYFLLMVAYEN